MPAFEQPARDFAYDPLLEIGALHDYATHPANADRTTLSKGASRLLLVLE
jgi:hypothetical protein